MPTWTPDTSDEDLLGSLGVPERTSGDPHLVDTVRGELVDGFAALAGVERAVSVFGSARMAPADAEYAQARLIAQRLGEADFTIITGGGPGLMEAANLGARDAGARSIGLNIELPRALEEPNAHLDLSLTFRHFFVRKIMFVRYASAFVVLPGGFGTLDELFEALTLIQTGKVHHFPVVLVGRRHWSGLLAWLHDHLLAAGCLSESDLALLHVSDDPAEIVALASTANDRQLASLRVPR